MFIDNGFTGNKVKVIAEDGHLIGEMSLDEAENMADEEELDLIVVSPKTEIGVCKMMDYGKYKYAKDKKDKENKRKQKGLEQKEIRLSIGIEENDINTKLKATTKFLEKGHPVKVVLMFKGREISHFKDHVHILDDFTDSLRDVATVMQTPKREGNSVSVVLKAKGLSA